MIRPHDADPIVVFSSEAPWPHRTCPRVAFGPEPPVWRPLGLDLLLAEPGNPRESVMLPTVMARLSAASVGPLLSAAEGPRTARLEAAGIPRCDAGGDLDAVRAGAYPALPELRRLALGVGTPRPRLVCVGERDPYDRLPMFAKSGVWLFRSLRLFGYDELSLYVTNALDPDNHSRPEALQALRDAFAGYEPTWLALGSVADDALRAAGIPHAKAPHPSQHRRFKFKSGPESYARLLKEAGVPPGHWLGKELPRTEPGSLEGEPCEALAERFGLPRKLAFTRGERHADKSHHLASVDAALVERVRRAYVLGDFPSFRKAAQATLPEANDQVLAGISKAGRVGKWDVERQEYLATVRDAAKSAASDAEAKSAVKSRRLAWEATELALTGFVKQLRDPEYHVRAQDVKAIGDFALAMSDRGDILGDATREALGQLTLPALAEKLRSTTTEMFGEVAGGGSGQSSGKPAAGDAG